MATPSGKCPVSKGSHSDYSHLLPTRETSCRTTEKEHTTPALGKAQPTVVPQA